MHMYAIHTIISEALCLVTYVQLNTVTVEVIGYTVLAYSY